MTAIRIIPASDDDLGPPFPYEVAFRLLKAIPGVIMSETDIPAIVAAGIRLGWPQSLVDWHWEAMRIGGVYDFESLADDGFSCTLWRDNIFFRFTSHEHEKACRPRIEALARELRCRVLQQ
ncbi:MAG: hypothetical protein KBG15_13125 [Kofleriaceae bacterium]|nr:hypothetical protein [Kofleriaceae bacterium]